MARDIRTSIHGSRLGFDPDDFLLQAGGLPGIVLKPWTVATVPSASVVGANVLIYVSNGASGSACLAVSDGTNWKQVAISGTSIASS